MKQGPKSFEKVFRRAKFILSDVSPATSHRDEDEIYSLMFNMNEIFEEFVAEELKQAMLGSGMNVLSQFSTHALLLRNGTKKFYVGPDIGVFRGKDAICLLDTKWKKLDPGKSNDNVSQADMYQMYAYGKEYRTPRVVLVYPRHGSLKEQVANYDHHPHHGETRSIVVGTVDVSTRMGTMEATASLRSTLRRLVGPQGDSARHAGESKIGKVASSE